MSIFRSTEVPCPSCQTPVSFELVHSVNAGRRGDLRQAILNRTFQAQPCPSCGFTFRVQPQFTYMDLPRGQFFAVWPADKVNDWREQETRSCEAFDTAFGAQAPPEARAIGSKLTPRAVFGWPALSEKLIAAEAGIDDLTLETAKVAIIRSLDSSPVTGAELRLTKVEPDQLLMGWIRDGTDEVSEQVSVPREVLSNIHPEAEAWKSIREELTAGPFVDYRRLFLAGEGEVESAKSPKGKAKGGGKKPASKAAKKRK
jgi:hypothetical protein